MLVSNYYYFWHPVLDSLVDPLQKTINFRPKQDAVKQEVDRNEDMIRSALRAIASLNRIKYAFAGLLPLHFQCCIYPSCSFQPFKFYCDWPGNNGYNLTSFSFGLLILVEEIAATGLRIWWMRLEKVSHCGRNTVLSEMSDPLVIQSNINMSWFWIQVRRGR